MRLIDANELKAGVGITINGMIDGDETEEELKLLGLFKAALEAAIDITPTIEAEPVRHSRWVNLNGSSAYYCEECGCEFKILSYERGDYERCPKCGAKMDKEE